jgi:predicted DNA binding protein
LINSSYIPYFVVQKDLCSVYHVTFYLDVPENIVANEITFYNILLKSRFSINSYVLENTDIKSNANVINEFSAEIVNEEKTTSFEYFNTINLNNKSAASCQLCTNIYLNSKMDSFYVDDGIFFEDMVVENEEIKKFVKILSENCLMVKKVR